MRYTPHSRERSRRLLALLTGVAAFATFAGAGTATGLAARDTADQEKEKAQAKARQEATAREAALRAARRQPVQVVPRPQRTVIHTRVVQRVSRDGVAEVGGGGVPQTSSGSAPPPPPAAPQPPTAPAAPPAPPPPPAPSSGS